MEREERRRAELVPTHDEYFHVINECREIVSGFEAEITALVAARARGLNAARYDEKIQEVKGVHERASFLLECFLKERCQYYVG